MQTCFTDTGGTFTDTFIIDEAGNFTVGKAPTTPQDLSTGYFESIRIAAEASDSSLDQCIAELAAIGYASTTVINTVITRTGKRVGLLISRGFGHLALMQRGVQSYTDFDLSDRLHARTHRLVAPLVDQADIMEVTERIDCLGTVIVPLYANECRRAAEALIDRGVESICVVFLYCWQNNRHELAAAEIVADVAREKGRQVDVYLSHRVNPIGREFPRFNATVIEAYTRDIAVGGLKRIEGQLNGRGYKGRLQIAQSTGGVTTTDSIRMVETLESGPVGGVIGAKYLSSIYGFDNFVTTDVGGTSFDIGIVSNGLLEIEQEPVCARMVLGVPMVAVNSIGAGGGTIARLDDLTGRLTVGPESAGASPGPVCYGAGGVQPTVTDADLVLGYINPGNFLGGQIGLDKAKAEQAIREQIAEPLGLKVEEAARGIIDIVDVRMREAIRGTILARGSQIDNYHLLAYGGAGPSHVAAYTRDLPLKGILVLPYSSVFCAFGAACSDYQRNFTRAANLVCVPQAAGSQKQDLARQLAAVWSDLEEQAKSELQADGFRLHEVRLEHLIRMRYGRQLDQILVRSPIARPDTERDWDSVVAAFEEQYAAMFTSSAMYPQAGYEVVEVSVVASVPKIKPVIPKHASQGAGVRDQALTGRRPCFFDGEWAETPVYAWEQIAAGNTLKGPAIVEGKAQTLVLPPERSIHVDEYLTVWMS